MLKLCILTYFVEFDHRTSKRLVYEKHSYVSIHKFEKRFYPQLPSFIFGELLKTKTKALNLQNKL